MINHHRPEGILPVQVNKMNDVYSLVYATNGYMLLKDYLLRHVLDDNALAKLVLSIVKPLLELDKYYLDENYIVIDLNQIYYDQTERQICYMYLPENQASSVNINERVTQLLRVLIYESVRLESPHSILVSEILKYLKEPGWHLKGLSYLVESCSENSLSREYDPYVSEVENVKPEVVKSESRLLYDDASSKKAVPEILSHEDNTTEVRRKVRQKLNPKTILWSVTGIIAGVIFGFVKSMSIDSTEKLGLVLVTGAILGLICKKSMNLLPVSEKVKGENQHLKSNVDIPVENRQKFEVEEDPSDSNRQEDRTVMMSGAYQGCALIGAAGQKIPLNKNKYLIGRQEGVADILIDQNVSVGRQHAELIKLESGYAVKDLRSVNGTFVNDKKVEYGQAIALLCGDILKISDESFTFTLS